MRNEVFYDDQYIITLLNKYNNVLYVLNSTQIYRIAEKCKGFYLDESYLINKVSRYIYCCDLTLPDSDQLFLQLSK